MGGAGVEERRGGEGTGRGKKKKVSANQERVQNFQINFEPLSPGSAKPQQLSCCDLILFFCPVTPFFFSFFFFHSSRICTSFLLEQPVGLKHTKVPRTNLPPSPKEANLPRTSNSSARFCAGSALRTKVLKKKKQPPPQKKTKKQQYTHARTLVIFAKV